MCRLCADYVDRSRESKFHIQLLAFKLRTSLARWSKANRNWVPVVLVKMWGPGGEITKLLSVQISIETAWNDDGCGQGSSGQWWMWGWWAGPNPQLWLLPSKMSCGHHPPKFQPPESKIPILVATGINFPNCSYFRYIGNSSVTTRSTTPFLWLILCPFLWVYGVSPYVGPWGILWLFGPWFEVPSLVRSMGVSDCHAG